MKIAQKFFYSLNGKFFPFIFIFLKKFTIVCGEWVCDTMNNFILMQLMLTFEEFISPIFWKNLQMTNKFNNNCWRSAKIKRNGFKIWYVLEWIEIKIWELKFYIGFMTCCLTFFFKLDLRIQNSTIDLKF